MADVQDFAQDYPDPLNHPAVPPGVFGTVAGAAEALEYVDAELCPACEECEKQVSDICGEVEGTLAECHAAVSAACRVVLGEAHAVTDQHLAAVRRIVDKLFREVQDQITTAATDLAGDGVNYPFDPYVQMSLNQSDPADWLPLAVPAFQQFITPREVIDRPFPDPVQCDDLGNCGDVPPVPPVPPICGPDAITGACDPFHGDGGTVPPPPIDPPVSPPVVPPPAECPTTCPAPVVQCPTIPPWPPIIFPPPVPPPTVTVVPGEPGECPTVIVSPPPPVVPVQPPAEPPSVSPGPPPQPPVPPPIGIVVPPGSGQTPTPPPQTIIINREEPDPQRLEYVSTFTFNCGTYCSDLETAINQAEGRGVPENRRPGAALESVVQYQSSTWRWLNRQAMSFRDGFEAVAETISNATRDGPTEALKQGTSVLMQAFNAVNPAANPNPSAGAYYALKLGVANWAERQTGAPISYMYQSDLYAYQAANPQYIISQPVANAAFHMGLLDDTKWRCVTRSLGNIECWQEVEREVSRPKLPLSDLITARRRGIIDNDLLFDAMAEKAGWTHGLDAKIAWRLYEQLPTQSDLLRFMVRDSADEKVVKLYEYDKDFNDKFTGKIKEWFDAQGIPREVALYFWRAHWQIPSPTQLFEMLHRFRPDRKEVKDWDKFASENGEIGAEASLGPRPVVVTPADVQKALEINDMAPGWVRAMMGISFHPLTRTDATRAYEIGSIDRAALKAVMQDNGYTEADAETLVVFYEQQKRRKLANATGALTIRKIIKFYKADAMTRLDAETELKKLMASEDDVTKLLDDSDTEAEAEHSLAMIKKIKSAWLSGAYTDEEAEQALNATGVQAARVAVLVRRWRDERRNSEKTVTAAKLCRWFRRRLITPAEYYRRLIALRYSDEDAQRLVRECQIG